MNNGTLNVKTKEDQFALKIYSISIISYNILNFLYKMLEFSKVQQFSPCSS